MESHSRKLEETLTGAPGHPFYHVERREFVRAGDLQPGDTLALPEGRTAAVVAVVNEVAEPGERFTTYNFEVDATHTYFVGESGVWVHNTSDVICQQAEAVYQKAIGANKSTADALKEVDDYLLRARRSGLIKSDEAYHVHRGDVANEMRARGVPDEEVTAYLANSAIGAPRVFKFRPELVDEFLDVTIAQRARSGKSKVFVIGENQSVVARAARVEGASNAWDFWPRNMDFRGIYDPAIHEAASIEFNRYLIRRLAKEGYTFVDNGIDATRQSRSAWYKAELDVLKELGITARALGH